MSRRAVLVFEVLAAYARARWVMRRSLPDAVAFQRATTRHTRPHLAVPLAEGRRLGRAVMRGLSVLPTDSRCLARSLTLTRLLARRDLPNTLVIGVRSSSAFLAHAWVELEGVPLLPTGGEDFKRLKEL